MKEVNNGVVDLFSEELNRKQRKKEKQIAKMRSKEKKRKSKKEKKLETLEDIEFAKRLEEKYQEEIEENEKNVVEELAEIKKEQNTRVVKNENILPKRHPILNFILGFFIIVLLLTSVDFAIYNIIKEKELEIIITSSLLCILSIFYILSIIIKKEGIKKFFQILATISITCYMCYQLFVI